MNRKLAKVIPICRNSQTKTPSGVSKNESVEVGCFTESEHRKLLPSVTLNNTDAINLNSAASFELSNIYLK